jgi:hypothetical protein
MAYSGFHNFLWHIQRSLPPLVAFATRRRAPEPKLRDTRSVKQLGGPPSQSVSGFKSQKLAILKIFVMKCVISFDLLEGLCSSLLGISMNISPIASPAQKTQLA